jgi:hypothetical protein
MNSNIVNYIFLICLSGFGFLMILSFMAFGDIESLKIKKGKNKNSGVMLLVDSLIYLFIGFFVFCKYKKNNNDDGYM